MSTNRAPFIIALPRGMAAGGVVTWAVRLAGALADRGRAMAIFALAEPADQAPLAAPVHPGVEVVDLRGVHAADARAGRLGPFLAAHRDTIRRMSDRAGAPAVVSPNLLGDCYGLAAAMCVSEPEIVRIVGVQHADIEYDARILAHYAPVIARFVGVSSALADGLRRRMPSRAGDIQYIPHGVEAPPAPPRREPLRGRPVRLIYTGRIEHVQKRISALVALSDALTARGIDHELTMIGDGPALAEMRSLAQTRPSLRLPGAIPLPRITEALDRADVFVLASRYEGLSVSMLEALARGCWPIVASVASGAADAIEPGVSGDIVPVAESDDDASVAGALADAVERFLRADQPARAHAAWERARTAFSLDNHADRWGELIDAAANSAPRTWPFDRPCTFTSSGAAAGSGSVPPDGAERLRALLASLAGRRVILHGAGRHTIELAGALADCPAQIVAVTDDDPARWGARLFGWPILAPASAARAEATDVILSSWMHADAMWSKRDVFERQGLTVHRLYAPRGP